MTLNDLQSVFDDKPQADFQPGRLGLDFLSKKMEKEKSDNLYWLLPGKLIAEVQDFDLLNELTDNSHIVYLSETLIEQIENLSQQVSGLQVRRLALSKLDIEMELIVTDKVVTINRFSPQQLGLHIDDEIISQSFHTILEMFWNLAE